MYEWPLMSSPWKLLGIIGVYLISIYIILPSYMDKRKPFALTNIIRLYNIFEIIINTVVIYGVSICLYQSSDVFITHLFVSVGYIRMAKSLYNWLPTSWLFIKSNGFAYGKDNVDYSNAKNCTVYRYNIFYIAKKGRASYLFARLSSCVDINSYMDKC